MTQLEKTLDEIKDSCYFILDTQVDTLLSSGFGGLPCLIRRNCGREIIRLKDLRTVLAKPLAPHDYLRDVSTFPECIEQIKKGYKYPAIPGKYHV